MCISLLLQLASVEAKKLSHVEIWSFLPTTLPIPRIRFTAGQCRGDVDQSTLLACFHDVVPAFVKPCLSHL